MFYQNNWRFFCVNDNFESNTYLWYGWDVIIILTKKLSLRHKSDFITPLTLQPNVVDLRYFKLWIQKLNQGGKDTGTRKFEFVAKNQFLSQRMDPPLVDSPKNIWEMKVLAISLYNL